MAGSDDVAAVAPADAPSALERSNAGSATSPSAAIAQPAETVHPVEFTATAGEYFRIWIVNLALTIVTLGIYSAWAKVRKRRYLYSHTRVAGEGFEYLAKPLPILLGRLIAVALLAGIVAADVLVPALAGSRLLRQALYIALLVAVGPWILVRSLRFNARNTAYRNIRFRFAGTYGGCLRVVAVYGWLLLIPIFYPYFKRRLVRFGIENHRYGATRFELPPEFGKPFAHAYWVAYGLFAMCLIAGSIVIVAGFLAMAGAGFHWTKSQLGALGLLWLPVYLAALGLASAYIHARTLNAVWNHLRIGPVRFSSSLRARDVIGIYATNALAVVLTVGFATPWAVVRSWRYRASKTALIAAGPLDGFVQAEADQVGAAGQEIGDMLDFDVSL